MGEAAGVPVYLDAALLGLFDGREVVIDAREDPGGDSFSAETELGPAADDGAAAAAALGGFRLDSAARIGGGCERGRDDHEHEGQHPQRQAERVVGQRLAEDDRARRRSCTRWRRRW